MKRIFFILIIFCLLATFVLAAIYEVKILTDEEIRKLSNDAIVAVYTDAMIEREATKTFYAKAGFTPKEYDSYRTLLTFVVRLRKEMAAREIEPPPVEEWLK
ncbi:MAG TPA: hypothetical protein PLH56_06300 [Candidatus Omnitrophota bacterium]|nr:hypothetical protein [Candidatus Omnitrophota bacterium]HPN88929.1 hypothetical protein [Candidatus Omnitrophota bacterium]